MAKIRGFTFGVRHRHLDRSPADAPPAPDTYDAVEAFEALRRPGIKYQNPYSGQKSRLGWKLGATMGIPIVDLVNKDISSFPGPASYKLPPSIVYHDDKDPNSKKWPSAGSRTRGGYMVPRTKGSKPRRRRSVSRSLPSSASVPNMRAKQGGRGMSSTRIESVSKIMGDPYA